VIGLSAVGGGGLAMAYRTDLFAAPSGPPGTTSSWGSAQYRETTRKGVINNIVGAVYNAAAGQGGERYHSPSGDKTYDTNPAIKEVFDYALTGLDKGTRRGSQPGANCGAPG
jgi:hypothetical protein